MVSPHLRVVKHASALPQKRRFCYCQAVALPSTWWERCVDAAWTSSGDISGDISTMVTSLKCRYALVIGTWHVNCSHLVLGQVKNVHPVTWYMSRGFSLKSVGHLWTLQVCSNLSVNTGCFFSLLHLAGEKKNRKWWKQENPYKVGRVEGWVCASTVFASK